MNLNQLIQMIVQIILLKETAEGIQLLQGMGLDAATAANVYQKFSEWLVSKV